MSILSIGGVVKTGSDRATQGGPALNAYLEFQVFLKKTETPDWTRRVQQGV